jgi:hypothetical protein
MSRTSAELEQRQNAAVKHGVTSPNENRRQSDHSSATVSEQNALRVGDLDAIGRARLDGWARAQAKCELLDRYFSEHGLFNDKGEPRPAAAIYFTALNSARLALTKLEEHLHSRIPRPKPSSRRT